MPPARVGERALPACHYFAWRRLPSGGSEQLPRARAPAMVAGRSEAQSGRRANKQHDGLGLAKALGQGEGKEKDANVRGGRGGSGRSHGG